MESTVLQPGQGQTVVTTDTHHNRHHGGENRYWETLTDKHEQRRVHEVDLDFASVEKAICGSERENLRSFSIIEKQVSDAATATVVGFKDSLAIAYQVEGRALLEAAKNANAASVQATMFANAASVQATANYNALSIEAVKNASAAELRAQTIAATAAAQAAECCCELKALVLSQGETTRALIASGETQRLRDQIQSMQANTAALFARNVSPVTPVA